MSTDHTERSTDHEPETVGRLKRVRRWIVSRLTAKHPAPDGEARSDRDMEADEQVTAGVYVNEAREGAEREATRKPLSRDQKFRVWELLLMTITAIVLVTTAVAQSRQQDNDASDSRKGSGQSVSPSSKEPTTNSPSPAATDYGGRVLFEVGRCERLKADSTLAKDLHRIDAAVIDGRCDGFPKALVGVYTGPTRESDRIGELETGQLVTHICLIENGQVIQDLLERRSKVWVEFDYQGRRAFASATWAQAWSSAEVCS